MIIKFSGLSSVIVWSNIWLLVFTVPEPVMLLRRIGDISIALSVPLSRLMKALFLEMIVGVVTIALSLIFSVLGRISKSGLSWWLEPKFIVLYTFKLVPRPEMFTVVLYLPDFPMLSIFELTVALFEMLSIAVL